MLSGKLRRLLILISCLILLTLIYLFHAFVLVTETHITVLYAVPVLIAALLLDTPTAVGVTVLALVLHSVDAYQDQTPPGLWAIESFTVLVLSALGIWAARERRAQRRLAEENSRLYAGQRRLNEELVESRRQREQFLGMVTHEIAGALTVLSGYAQMVAKREVRSAETEARLLEQVQRLSRLVGDLQDLSRIERGQLALFPKECDLVTLAHGVVRGLQPTTARHEIRLEADDEAVLGEWDCDRIAQVLGNLLRNAINYSPDGGLVEVRVKSADSGAEFSVTDRGVGISPEDRERLFQPYSRLERTREVRGTGLGLYVSKMIVEAHGGRIGVESEPGRGSTFYVWLPRRSPGSSP